MQLKTIRQFSLTALCSIFLLSACDNAPVDQGAINSLQGFSDVEGISLEVGKPAPEFSLESIHGTNVSLSGLRGSHVLLIFYRGYWCPFCIGHLEDIQTIFPELEKSGYKIIAISPDHVSGLQMMSDQFDKPYLFLSDPQLETIQSYGIRKDDKLPHPAVIMIDKSGIVQWFYVGENYKERPSATQIMNVVARLNRGQQ